MDSKPVVGKCAKSYCMDLHELLEAHNMAPKILKFSNAPSVWNIIVWNILICLQPSGSCPIY
jgi:hypothetical protein